MLITPVPSIWLGLSKYFAITAQKFPELIIWHNYNTMKGFTGNQRSLVSLNHWRSEGYFLNNKMIFFYLIIEVQNVKLKQEKWGGTSQKSGKSHKSGELAYVSQQCTCIQLFPVGSVGGRRNRTRTQSSCIEKRNKLHHRQSVCHLVVRLKALCRTKHNREGGVFCFVGFLLVFPLVTFSFWALPSPK